MGYRIWLALGAASFVASTTLVTTGAEANSDEKNQAQIELGRRLFFDPTVSNGGKFSCADCHDPEHGFSDPRPLSVDVTGPTARHSQPLTDLAGEGFHWDGEFDTLRQLLVARLALPREAMDQARALHEGHFQDAEAAGKQPDQADFDRRIQSLTPPYYGPVTPSGPAITPTAITHRLTQDDRYAEAFKLAYSTPDITTDNMIDAMEKYLLTLKSTESPYDRFQRGDADAISASAKRGLTLFRGKAGCVECHVEGGATDRSLTDGSFHNTGVASPFTVLPQDVAALATASTAAADAGRGTMTFSAVDTGRFKTPNLRDVAKRPPYMHDASLNSLTDVVAYYNDGGTPNSHLSPKVRKLGLTDGEVKDVVAFLESLSGDERAGIGPVPRYRKKDDIRRRRIRIEDLAGRPLENTSIRVTPVGDRLQGTESMPRPFFVETDKRGMLDFDFPLSTHVILESDGYEIGESRMLPDTASRQTFVATPIGKISIRVHADRKGQKLPESLRLLAQNRDDLKATVGAEFRLTRVRELDSNHRTALYVMPVSDMRGVHLMKVFGAMDKGEIHLGQYEIDLNGGASDPIDLRAAPRRTLSVGELDDIRRRRSRAGGPTPPGALPPSRNGAGVTPPAPTPPAPRRPGVTSPGSGPGIGRTR